MDIFKDVVINLMFSICLITTHPDKAKWLDTPMNVHLVVLVFVTVVLYLPGRALSP